MKLFILSIAILLTQLSTAYAGNTYICDKEVSNSSKNEFNWPMIQDSILLESKSMSFHKLNSLIDSSKYSKSNLTFDVQEVLKQVANNKLNSNLVIDVNPFNGSTEIFAGAESVIQVSCASGVTAELINIANIIAAAGKIHTHFVYSK